MLTPGLRFAALAHCPPYIIIDSRVGSTTSLDQIILCRKQRRALIPKNPHQINAAVHDTDASATMIVLAFASGLQNIDFWLEDMEISQIPGNGG